MRHGEDAVSTSEPDMAAGVIHRCPSDPDALIALWEIFAIFLLVLFDGGYYQRPMQISFDRNGRSIYWSQP